MSTPTIHVATCLIADLLAIPPEDVTGDLLFSYGIGWMDEGACCCWWRPGMTAATAPATSASGAYTVAWASEWPNPAPTGRPLGSIITDGGDA